MKRAKVPTPKPKKKKEPEETQTQAPEETEAKYVGLQKRYLKPVLEEGDPQGTLITNWEIPMIMGPPKFNEVRALQEFATDEFLLDILATVANGKELGSMKPYFQKVVTEAKRRGLPIPQLSEVQPVPKVEGDNLASAQTE